MGEWGLMCVRVDGWEIWRGRTVLFMVLYCLWNESIYIDMLREMVEDGNGLRKISLFRSKALALSYYFISLCSLCLFWV